jgi:hypothetical protein
MGRKMMEVTLEEAYAEACRALGEAQIRERFLTRALNEAQARLASLES